MSPWLALVALAIFLIGLTKSGFGSGAGLMIVPMTAIAMRHLPAGAEAALPLLLPLLIVGDLVAIYQYRAHFSARIITRLLPGTVVGVVLGSLLLRWFAAQKELAEALINVEIGLESVVLVSINWYREWRSRHGVPPYRPSIVKSTAVGTFAGTSSTLAHAAGPIVALHLLPQRLERGVFVGTCALYFFLVNTAKLPGYYATGLFAQLSPAFSLRFLPLVLLGALFGRWLNRRIHDTLFTRAVYAITFALGAYLLLRGAGTLLQTLHPPAT
jgi:uncharacterized membrane protein YfcA